MRSGSPRSRARSATSGRRRTTSASWRFAKETGGAAFLVNDPDELKEAVARINGELRYQYLIGYRPSHVDWDGSFRQIRVQTRAGRYTVRTRTGYYANP